LKTLTVILILTLNRYRWQVFLRISSDSQRAKRPRGGGTYKKEMSGSHSNHPQPFIPVAYVAFQANADCVSEVRKHVSSFLEEDSDSAFIIGCRCDRRGNVKSLLHLSSSLFSSLSCSMTSSSPSSSSLAAATTATRM